MNSDFQDWQDRAVNGECIAMRNYFGIDRKQEWIGATEIMLAYIDKVLIDGGWG